MPSDNFNRANETPLAAPWTWNTSSPAGTVNLASNKVSVPGGGGDRLYYYSAAASSGDHDSECRHLQDDSGVGTAVRVQSASFSSYYATATLGANRLYKLNAGSFTSLGDMTINIAVNDLVKVTARGSTMRVYVNSVEDGTSPFTDTDLTGGQPGFFCTVTGDAIDDWNGGDPVAATPIWRPDQSQFPKQVPTDTRRLLPG